MAGKITSIDTKIDTEERKPQCTSDDFEDVVRRQDDIDQLTADYILGLMELSDTGIEIEDVGCGAETLLEIEDAFESILAYHGIIIHRPVVIADEFGSEEVVYSAYED